LPDPSTTTALRGPCLTFVGNPFVSGDQAALHYEPDGLVVMRNGLIEAFGDYRSLRAQLDGAPITCFSKDHLILPGFIDAHVHYPQLQVMGSYGKRLIDWLNEYTFIAEQQF